MSASALVTVHVLDKNDEIPVFSASSYVFLVGRNQANGTEVGRVLATDADSPPYDEVVYYLVWRSDKFAVDRSTGAITLTRDFVQEPKDIYHLRVSAQEPDPRHVRYMQTSISIIVVEDAENIDCLSTESDTV